MLHLSLWGRKALANQDSAGMKRLADWLLCQSAVVLLRGCSGPSGSSVEAELQRCFLSNLDLEDLRMAVGFLVCCCGIPGNVVGVLGMGCGKIGRAHV